MGKQSKTSPGLPEPASKGSTMKAPVKKAPAGKAPKNNKFLDGVKGGLTANKVSKKLKMAR